jgi:hypothetical protein
MGQSNPSSIRRVEKGRTIWWTSSAALSPTAVPASPFRHRGIGREVWAEPGARRKAVWPKMIVLEAQQELVNEVWMKSSISV